MTDRRRYSTTQQFGTMLLALNEGIVVAAEKTGTPQATIYSWFRRSGAGGIKEVRIFAEEVTQHALLTAEQAIYAQIANQAAGEEELHATFRKLIEARLGHDKPGLNINLTQQQAQGADGRSLSAAEQAYIATLRGQPSLESGADVSLPALPLSGNGTDGSLPSEDSE